MILLDSLYINNSGGKVLLDYLISELEKRNMDVYYLFDMRCVDDFNEIPEERRIFLKANLRNKYKFYKKNGNKFSSVFCFGNFAPPLKLGNKKVITYFHQPYFLKGIYPNNIKMKIKVFLQKLILYLSYGNTDIVIVQSDYIKEEFEKTYNISPDKILTIPFFYIPSNKQKRRETVKNSFVYVSGGNVHKNHLRLLKAWKLLFDEGYVPELGLTIDEKLFPQINNEIKRLQKKGLKIINYGFTDPYPLYDKYEYLIYPSLLETLGLGQVEAIKRGCKVIASDLPHTYAVIQPSFTFNPLDVKSIKNIVIKTLDSKNVCDSKIIVENKIEKLIDLIR